MRKLLVVACLSGAALLRADAGPAAFAPFQNPAAPPPNAGVVVGVVIDEASDKPIPDAVVTAMLRGPAGSVQLQRVLTDPGGRFALTRLPNQPVTIGASKPGFTETAWDDVLTADVRAGERITNAVIRLTKYASISGRVIDDLGDPLVGVAVTVFRRVFYAGRPRLDDGVSAQTDDRGMYRVSTLLPGDYVVAVPATQVSLPFAAVADYSGTDQLARREAFFNIAQVLNSISRMGSANAERIGNVVLQSSLAAYRTQSAGSENRAMTYQTTFAPSVGLPADATVVSVQSGDQREGVNVQLVLVPAVTVSGFVVGPDGPIGTAAVTLSATDEFPRSTAEFARASGITDQAGAFTLLNVPPGRYTLRASNRPPSGPSGATFSALWEETALTVGDKAIDNLQVTLRRPFRITGRIVFEGATPSPSDLTEFYAKTPLFAMMADARDAEILFPAKIGVDETFETSPAPRGRYLLTIPASLNRAVKSAMYQGVDITRTPVELKDDDISGVVVTLTDRTAKLSGAVRNSQGSPDNSATVLVFPSDTSAWQDFGWIPRFFFKVRTAPDGTYALSSVLTGDYFVVAAVSAPRSAAAIDLPGSLRDWLNPAFLAAVSRVATKIHVNDGSATVQDLKTTPIR